MFIQEKKEEFELSFQIKKAAVLGSGVMGSGIAAHLANIGIPTLLLDIVPEKLTEDEKAKGLSKARSCIQKSFCRNSLAKIIKTKACSFDEERKLGFDHNGKLGR